MLLKIFIQGLHVPRVNIRTIYNPCTIYKEQIDFKFKLTHQRQKDINLKTKTLLISKYTPTFFRLSKKDIKINDLNCWERPRKVVFRWVGGL